MLFWLVGFVIFQPIHLGVPLLYVLIYRDDSERSQCFRQVIFDGVLSSAIVFLIAAFLAKSNLLMAIILVVCSMPLPWVRILWRRD